MILFSIVSLWPVSVTPPSYVDDVERERFTNDQVEQVLSQLFSGLAVFHAQICDWLIEADVSQQFLVDGARDLAQWVSGRFDLRHSTAGQLVRVSRRLRDLPLLRERFAAGEMSLDQVDAISKLATPSTEEALIAECAGLSNAALDRAARRSRPPSTEDALDAFRERWFSIQYTLGGIRGHMDAVAECVVTDHRRVLGIGHRSRLIPAWLRRQLWFRDGGCRFRGCPERHCVHGHHRRHWSQGEPTHLDNLILLCGYHHRFVHEHGWKIETDPDGLPLFRRHDDEVYPPRRPPPHPRILELAGRRT